jgi:hypothetical protein
VSEGASRLDERRAERARATDGTSSSGRTALALLLIALAAVFAVLYRHENSGEDHSYNAGNPPPASVEITAGKQYEISTPGGMDTLLAGGGDPTKLNCNYTPLTGNSTLQLATTGLATDTRTTHSVGTFIGPVTGMVRIECRALTTTYIDDADNVSADPAGLFLLLCTLALTAGAGLLMSSLYRRGAAGGAHAAIEPADPVADEAPDITDAPEGRPGNGSWNKPQ